MKRSSKLLYFLIFIGLAFSSKAQVNHWETIVFDSSDWHYAIPTNSTDGMWYLPNYDDSNWNVAAGGFGIGDQDDNTVLPNGTTAVYQRIHFQVSSVTDIQKLILAADFDDGFVAYLNGTEIARFGFSTGVYPQYNDFAEGQHEAQLYQGLNPESFILTFNTVQSLLVSGDNVLSIQTHNVSVNSTDMSARYFLLAGINQVDSIYSPIPSWFIPPFEFYESNLPIVVINTYGVTIPDEPKIDAYMGIIHHDDGTMNTINDEFDEFDGLISIEKRGSSSNSFPAKSYGLETRGPDSVNYNVSVFNWPIDNDWILYAPYTDKSLIRNVLTYDLGDDMGRWAPRTQMCELVLNGDYMGVYVFMERIKVNPGRVNIDPLLPTDTTDNQLTGGYILKVDKTTANGVVAWNSPFLGGAPSTSIVPFQLHDPEIADLHPSQLNYIQQYITQWETNLAGPNFNDPNTGYASYIDIESFIDFYLMNEITRNVDGYRISSFLYKERFSEGGRIVAGPLWDFNIALGNANYCYGQNTDGWASNFNEYCAGGLDVPFWWNRLLEDSAYQQKVRCRWEYLRSNSFGNESLIAKIDTLYNQLTVPAERHFTRWPILSTYVWPNFFIGDTYLEEMDYLKTWLINRVTWMDANMWGDSCQIDLSVPYENLDASLSIFPNPAQDQLFINLKSSSQGLYSIAVFDMVGQQVLSMTEAPRNQIQLNIASLPSGIYLLKVTDAQSKIRQTKFIIER
jgi:hypothetical protein